MGIDHESLTSGSSQIKTQTICGEDRTKYTREQLR